MIRVEDVSDVTRPSRATARPPSSRRTHERAARTSVIVSISRRASRGARPFGRARGSRLRSPPRPWARRTGNAPRRSPSVLPRRDVTRVRGPDELGRPPFTGRLARSARGSPGVWGTARRRPRSHRPMSAAHDSVFKTNAHSSRHTPRRFPTTREPSVHADGLASASRRTGARRVVPRDRVAVRTSDAPSLRGLPGGTLPRPPARPAGRTRRPRVVPESLGLLPPCSVKITAAVRARSVFRSPRAYRTPGDPGRTLLARRPEGRRAKNTRKERFCSVTDPLGTLTCLRPSRARRPGGRRAGSGLAPRPRVERCCALPREPARACVVDAGPHHTGGATRPR